MFTFFKAQVEVPNLGDVRLVDGTDNRTPIRGRLETYYLQLDFNLPSVWGTVCSTGFDEHDGDVVCQQLGFQSAYRVGTVRELGYVVQQGPFMPMGFFFYRGCVRTLI